MWVRTGNARAVRISIRSASPSAPSQGAVELGQVLDLRPVLGTRQVGNGPRVFRSFGPRLLVGA
eukprot:6292935-Pyramimonas_sp.AAC.1